MFEPTSDKVFDPTPIKVPFELYQWKKDNNVKNPTKHALLYGGFLIDVGFKNLIFEAKFDDTRVDTFVEEIRLITEVDGPRQPEESLNDGRRDLFILLNSNIFVQRISNQQIADFIPKDQQIRLSLLGVQQYIRQLEFWKENGIPDYYKKYKNENTPSVFVDDIVQSLDEIGWLN